MLDRPRIADHSVTVSFDLNGTAVSVAADPFQSLASTLRDRLGLTGTKQSCEVQVCGVCTVLVDGNPVSSCCYLAADIDGREVETIEGLAGSDFHRRASAAFLRHAAVQCGFCTGGLLLTAKALASGGISADRAQIAAAMNGNLCRCTGYVSLLDALVEVLDQR